MTVSVNEEQEQSLGGKRNKRKVSKWKNKAVAAQMENPTPNVVKPAASATLLTNDAPDKFAVGIYDRGRTSRLKGKSDRNNWRDLKVAHNRTSFNHSDVRAD